MLDTQQSRRMEAYSIFFKSCRSGPSLWCFACLIRVVPFRSRDLIDGCVLEENDIGVSTEFFEDFLSGHRAHLRWGRIQFLLWLGAMALTEQPAVRFVTMS